MSLQISRQTLSCQGLMFLSLKKNKKQIKSWPQLTNLKYSAHNTFLFLMTAMFSRCILRIVIDPFTPPLSFLFFFLLSYKGYGFVYSRIHVHMCTNTHNYSVSGLKHTLRKYVVNAHASVWAWVCVLLNTLQFITQRMYALHSSKLQKINKVNIYSFKILPSNVGAHVSKYCAWYLCTCV